MRRAAFAAAAAGAVVVAASVALAADGNGGAPARASSIDTATATVERRDLVDRETVDGTLGYSDTATLPAGVTGTITALPASGAVVRRGGSLYDVDGAHAAWLLYGRLPAWRDFTPGMSDGVDVGQLERNLRALGYDPHHAMTVDGHWTSATTAAVERFQDARDMTEDGTLARGEVVFRRGPTRIGELRATVGQTVAPGAQVADVSSTEREITVALDADRQQIAHVGATVTVDLPDGRTGRGVITNVGKVATKPTEDGGSSAIDVAIALRGRAARGTGLDQAPVTVGFARERRRHVLAVPVTALLARSGGGYAVEVVEAGGHHRLVPVQTGVYADDAVEVTGDGLRAGTKVVSAQ